MNLLLIILGFVFLSLGILGVILPILPTTPFLIVASILFAKSSKRFDKWFKGTNLYQNYVGDFVRDRSMTLKSKIKILLLADSMLAISFIVAKNLYVRVFILIIAIIKFYYFIFKIKTKKD